MQLLIIAMVIPLLVLLSQTVVYKWVRISAAVLAAIVAVAWVTERCSGQSNIITSFVASISIAPLA
jgi:hypothetical protein